MDTRQRRSEILHLLGFGALEARTHAAEASLALTLERLRMRIALGIIPAAVWTALALWVLGTIYLAVRAARAAHVASVAADDARAVTTTTTTEPSAESPAPATVS